MQENGDRDGDGGGGGGVRLLTMDTLHGHV